MTTSNTSAALSGLLPTRLFAAIIITAVSFAAGPQMAMAGDKDRQSITNFYAFLSNAASESHADGFRDAVSADWQSIGDYSGKTKSGEELIAELQGLSQLVPDMNWEIAEMIRSGNRVLVRGHATGTPVGPFFGVDGQGRSFEIMSMDLHTLDDGKIIRTYHVEDWAGAIQQLSGR